MSTIAELFARALRYHQSGNLRQAEPLYRQILQADPTHADAHHLLGLVAHQTGHHEPAAALLRRAIALNPSAAVYHTNLGLVLEEQGQWDEAIACYRRVLQLTPDEASAHYNLGCAFREQEQWAGAVECCQQALRLNPQFVDALNLLGLALKEQGQLDEAITCYRRALEIKPDYPEALNNLGFALNDQGRLDEAIACASRVVQLQPNNASAFFNLGMFFEHDQKLAEAITCYSRTLELQPRHALAPYARALTLLLSGDYARGWLAYELASESRYFRLPHLRRDFREPQWMGSDLNGLTILLHAEEGFGDALQFVRYVPLVAARGGRVVLECPPSLKSLFAHVEGVTSVVARGEPLPRFDRHSPLQSLPRAFGTTLDNLPAHVPYLGADPALISAWQCRLQDDDVGFKVGLVWAGSKQKIDPRSDSLQLFAPLVEVPGVGFYSLQKGVAAGQASAPPTGINLVDHTAGLHDFADTAALVANLDLVISVDTAVAHLAGAMGKPVWTLIPRPTDFRWLLDRPDSPWYPTMRLFRQRRPGDWGEVFERITAELRTQVKTRSGS